MLLTKPLPNISYITFNGHPVNNKTRSIPSLRQFKKKKKKKKTEPSILDKYQTFQPYKTDSKGHRIQMIILAWTYTSCLKNQYLKECVYRHSNIISCTNELFT